MPESGPKTPKSPPCYLFTHLAIYLDDAVLVEITLQECAKNRKNDTKWRKIVPD
jgi:hypothetical protein